MKNLEIASAPIKPALHFSLNPTDGEFSSVEEFREKAFAKLQALKALYRKELGYVEEAPAVEKFGSV